MYCLKRLNVPLFDNSSRFDPAEILVEQPSDKSIILPAFNGRFIAFADSHYYVILNCYGMKIIPFIINHNEVDIFNFEKIEVPYFSTISIQSEKNDKLNPKKDILEYGQTYYLRMNGRRIMFNITYEGIYFTSNSTIINRIFFEDCDIANSIVGFDFFSFPIVNILTNILTTTY